MCNCEVVLNEATLFQQGEKLVVEVRALVADESLCFAEQCKPLEDGVDRCNSVGISGSMEPYKSAVCVEDDKDVGWCSWRRGGCISDVEEVKVQLLVWAGWKESVEVRSWDCLAAACVLALQAGAAENGDVA